MDTLQKSKDLAVRLVSLTDPSMHEQAIVRSKQNRNPCVYVPACIPAVEFIDLLDDPTAIALESRGKNGSGEPIYGCLGDALAGRNADGTAHQAFVILEEAFGGYIKDYVDREKETLLPSEFQQRYMQGIIDGAKQRQTQRRAQHQR